MSVVRKFENRMEDSLEGIADRMSNAPISPVKIAKKAEKQMQREKIVGAGKQYAPTLYTVIVNVNDDARLFGYYPTLAGETETYLAAKAESKGLVMDGQPLVRFIADDSLKSGKFDVIAEAVAAPIVEQLRMEEMQRYGIVQTPSPFQQGAQPGGYAPQAHQSAQSNAAYYPQDQLGNDNSWNGQPDQGLYGESWHEEPGFAAAPNIPDAQFNQPQDAVAAVAPATMVMNASPHSGQGANEVSPTFAKFIDTASGQNYIVHAQRTVIGRGTGSDVILPDLNVSRIHAELRLEPQGFWSLTDLNSTNGTALNGRRIASSPIQEGDIATIGTTNLAFSLH